jgi:hypothetical protein
MSHSAIDPAGIVPSNGLTGLSRVGVSNQVLQIIDRAISEPY